MLEVACLEPVQFCDQKQGENGENFLTIDAFIWSALKETIHERNTLAF